MRAWLQLFHDNQSVGAKAVLVGTKLDLVDWVNPLKEEAEVLARQEEMEIW